MSLHFSYFFDLSNCHFRELFEKESHLWLVISQIKAYLNKLQLGQIEGQISPSAYLINPELISIGQGTVVEPGAYIQGPCFIGKDCTIRHGAYIRGNVLTGDKCVIGHDSEVKNSILLDGAQAAHFAYVGDSILGNQVNLGAGTKCANLKLNHGSIVLYFENQKIETNLRKMGVILGDRSQLGCNTVTNPGTLIGQDVLCYPCTNLGGFVSSRSIVKPETKLIIKSY